MLPLAAIEFFYNYKIGILNLFQNLFKFELLPVIFILLSFGRFLQKIIFYIICGAASNIIHSLFNL